MKKYLLVSVLLSLFIACNQSAKENVVVIHTSYGSITVRLYDKTPIHRDNFLALAKRGFFDSTLFHRVIEGFMIQAGDPDSKHAIPGQLLGDGDTTYTLAPEFIEEYLNKRGALAAARESDDVNPEKKSSACQFYIVQGKKFTDAGLDSAEDKRNRYTKSFMLMKKLKQQKDTLTLSTFQEYFAKRDIPNIEKMLFEYRELVNQEYLLQKPWKLTTTQRKIYKTLGGAPHLDGAYTVFGEVESGMEVVDRIAAAARDSNDRPLKDIRIWVELK